METEQTCSGSCGIQSIAGNYFQTLGTRELFFVLIIILNQVGI
jgi:hypothetical protein